MFSRSEIDFLVAEISRELRAKKDGGNKNLIADCPYCGKAGKFGVFIGKETERKKLFMGHCFSCGQSTTTLDNLLELIGRPDLMITQTAKLDAKLDENLLFPLDNEDEVDDSLGIVDLPEFYKRMYTNEYLRSRGFVYDDYEYFPVGTTGRLNNRFRDYVIFPVIDDGDTVGYVARHTWTKDEIEEYNRKARQRGDYKILRYRNSTENDFVKLLYNYDAVIEDETDTVILTEGVFDVIALTRKLEWYDNTKIAAVATFGKKISLPQVYKLQKKRVKTVVIGYDGDAVEAIKKAAAELNPYFNVWIADIQDKQKDWEDLTCEEIYHIFSYRLQSPVNYSINKIQE